MGMIAMQHKAVAARPVVPGMADLFAGFGRWMRELGAAWRSLDSRHSATLRIHLDHIQE